MFMYNNGAEEIPHKNIACLRSSRRTQCIHHLVIHVCVRKQPEDKGGGGGGGGRAIKIQPS